MAFINPLDIFAVIARIILSGSGMFKLYLVLGVIGVVVAYQLFPRDEAPLGSIVIVRAGSTLQAHFVGENADRWTAESGLTTLKGEKRYQVLRVNMGAKGSDNLLAAVDWFEDADAKRAGIVGIGTLYHFNASKPVEKLPAPPVVKGLH